MIMKGYVFLFCLQVLCFSGLLLYYRKKIKQALNGKEIEAEIRSLIVAFNRNADRNIRLLEDRITQMKALFREMSQSRAWSEEKVLSRKIQKSPSSGVSQTKPVKKKPPSTPLVRAVLPPKAKEKNRPDIQKKEQNLVQHLEENARQRFEDLTLREKVRYLNKQNTGEWEIAKRLNLSVSEVTFFIRQ